MVELLAQFRNQLYEKLHLYNWADCGMDLMDALASAQGVRSVVELSLQPAFRSRHPSGLFNTTTVLGLQVGPQPHLKARSEHWSGGLAPLRSRSCGEGQARSTIYGCSIKAIRFFPLSGQEMMALFAPYLPLPQQRPFRLLAVDTLPHPRPFAECLEDRGYIYAPNPTPGQKPIAIGHTCSLLAFLPEREDELLDPPWAVFLDAQRVATSQNAAQVGQRQIVRWLQIQAQANPSWRADQTLVVADSRYSTPAFIFPLVMEAGTNGLVRLSSKRVVFGPPPEEAVSGAAIPTGMARG